MASEKHVNQLIGFAEEASAIKPTNRKLRSYLRRTLDVIVIASLDFDAEQLRRVIEKMPECQQKTNLEAKLAAENVSDEEVEVLLAEIEAIEATIH